MNVLKFMFGITSVQETELDVPYHPSVSVMIPSYNEESLLASTIESIKKQSYPINQIIVVDDGSTDRTGEIACELGATVVRTEKNTGTKSRAQNYGIKYVASDVFVTIDADTILKSDAIEKLIPLLADGKTLSACGFVVPARIKTIWERARFAEYLLSCGLYKSAQAHWGTPLVSSGCFSAFNINIFKTLGGFPENNIAEDMALTWKALLNGYNIKYGREAVCYPKDPENWIQYRNQALRWYCGFFQCITEYKMLFLRKLRLLGFVAYYLSMSLLSMVWLGITVYVILTGMYGFGSLIAGSFLLETAIAFAVILIYGHKRGKTREAISGYPLLWFVNPLNWGLFLWACIQEWGFKHKLSTWEKGH